MKYKRIFLIVIDSLGIGAMPDAEKFGDIDVDTFGHIVARVGALEIPHLKKLGLLNLHPCPGVPGMEPEVQPAGMFMRMAEASNSKDTMSGHWEMMGVYTEKPFKTFSEHGFPPELIAELEKRTGKQIIGNKAASGTEILDEMAEQEINEGKLIRPAYKYVGHHKAYRRLEERD